MSYRLTPIGKADHQIVNASDYNATGSPTYVGWALPGTADSAAAWLIAKITYDGSGNFLTLRYANGVLQYNQVWNDRAALSYA